jgi:hypothetical protein
MNYSIRHCAFVISALLIGVSAIDLHTPAQAEGTIDQTAAIGAGAEKIAEAGQRNIDAARRAKQARPKRPGTIDQTAAIGAGAEKIAEAGQMNIDAARRAKQARSTRQRHDNLQAQNLAYAALTQCYTYNNANGCSQLNRIKSTLATWCEQNDRDSCTVYRNVVGFEGLKINEQTTEDLSKIAGGAG